VLLLAGCLAPTAFGSLPPAPVVAVLAVLSVICLAHRKSRLFVPVLAGAALMCDAAGGILRARLDPSLEGTDIRGRFRVLDFPVPAGPAIRLLVAPEARADLPDRIRITWYDAAEPPRIGDCWDLEVRLRRPRGTVNPGGFDYEGWLFRQRIGATGYVKRGHGPVDCARPDRLALLRRRLAARLDSVLPAGDARASLGAITIGARHRIDREQWDRYAITGTSHLMAISGLHIGLAAAVAFLVFRVAFAWVIDGNSRDPAAVGAALVATAYVVLSGFAVPARRALGMLLLVMLAMSLRYRPAPFHVLCVVAVLIAVADPTAVLAPGFQLSFAAVAILVGFGAQPGGGTLRARGFGNRVYRAVAELSRLQLALLLGLLPFTVLHFDRVSWIAPAVNLLAVPVFNAVTTPAALLGLSLAGPLAPIGDGALLLAWHSMNAVLRMVDIAAELPGANRTVAHLHGASAVLPWLAPIWVLLPPSWPARRVAWLAGIATAMYVPEPVPAACADLRILDVGQGLAVVVRTRSSAMVYDTGPSFRTGGSTGALVVAPYLRSQGIRRVDLLVVSHADSDHAGGAAEVVASLPVDMLLAGEPLERLPVPQLPCRAGQTWHWDRVRFTVLHPGASNGLAGGNDRSCVIEVAAGRHSVLFTGDIESDAERSLLDNGLLDPVDLVVVPHHGSRSSSQLRLVDTLRPSVAVISAGYANRWGLPRTDIVSRWQRAGSLVLNTATDGAIGYRVCAGTGLTAIGRERRDRKRVWIERE